jgi:membrane-associated protease RseP (regulator of RpoE activity)
MVMGLTPELRKHFGAPEDRGVLVARVDPGTPAASAGVEVGDVIIEVHGRKIDAAPDVLSALSDLGKGEHAKIELVRNGQARTVDATLVENAPPAWLRNWMKPFEARQLFPSPFDEPWFRPWLKPSDEVNSDMNSSHAPNWLDKLRELFAPEHNQTSQRT